MGRGKRQVYRIKDIRFMGDRKWLPGDLDAYALIREIMAERCNTQNFTHPISLVKEFNGHELEFTQTQTRSKLLHVKELNKGEADEQ